MTNAPRQVAALRAVTKRYGPVVAVSEVDLELSIGEVHVVAGENGAGKSTLMRLLAQIERPDAGEVEIDGSPVPFEGPRGAQRQGIAMVHQELALAPDLTVAENLFLGREPARAGVIDRGRQVRDARALLEQVHLAVDPERTVRALSVAEQQLVEIAKALGTDARVVIMDEPTATLSDNEVADLFDVIARLRAREITVLYISHRLEEIFRVADRVTVMRDGRIVDTRRIGDLDERTLVRLMVGREVTELYPAPETAPGNPVLTVRGLAYRDRIGPCDLVVREREVVGIAGLVGSGRTELMRMAYGAHPHDHGSIEVDGVPRRIQSPADGLRAGICYLSEDRKGDGLATGMSVAHNLTMASLPTRVGALLLGEERRRALYRKEELDIRTPSIDSAVRTLSGGNQQKVAVGKLLETRARVLLLDEPARGIDVGAKAEMFRLVAELARGGAAIALVSSYLPELLAMCHRIVVLREGRVAGQLDRTAFSEEAVVALATGARGAG